MFGIESLIQSIVYETIKAIALIVWFFDVLNLLLANIVQATSSWMTGNLNTIIPVINEPFGIFIAFSLTIAIVVYGISRIFSPFMDWNPVDPGKAFMYGLFGFFYITSAVFFIDLIEGVRVELSTTFTTASTTLFSGMLTDVIGGGDGFYLGSPNEVDGREGISGVDIAGTYLGMSSPDDFSIAHLPSELQSGYRYTPSGTSDCCFPVTASQFSEMDDTERSEAITNAAYGLRVLIMGYILTPYAFIVELTWFILTLGALIIFISLPIGFVFAPFRSMQGLLTGYVAQYIALFKETIVTAIILGLGYAMILGVLQLSLVLLFPVYFIVTILSWWRAISAFKVTGNAIGGLTSGAGGDSAKSGMSNAAGMMGAVAVGGVGLATGNPMMAKYGAMSLAGGRGVTPAGLMLMADKSNGSGGAGGGNGNGNSPSGNASNGGDNGSRLSGDAAPVANADDAGSVDAANQDPSTPSNEPSSFGSSKARKPRVQSRMRTSQAKQAVKSWDSSFATGINSLQVEADPQPFGAAGERVRTLAKNPETAEHTQEVSNWMSGHISGMHDDGATNAEVFEDFQSGHAHHLAQESGLIGDDSAFMEDDNFYAMTDMMMPSQATSYSDIVSAVAHSPENYDPVDGALMNLGVSDDNFGSYSNLVSGVHATANEIGALDASGEQSTYLEDAYAHIANGDREAAADVLRDFDPEGSKDLLDRLEIGEKLLDGRELSPSTAYKAGDAFGHKNSYLEQPLPATAPQQSQQPAQGMPSARSAATSLS